MRTIDEIKKAMTDVYIGFPFIIQLYGLDPTKSFEQQFSKVSIESIFFYTVAYAIWTLESLFYHFIDLTDDKIRNQRAHTTGWYRATALNFQFGGVLKDDITEYDNSGLSDEEIETQRIIKKCSVVRVENSTKPKLLIKAARANGKLNDNEKDAFTAYMEAKADSGVNVAIVSEDADRLVIYLKILYEATIMSANGVKFLDGSRPVDDGVTEYLNNLEYNGTFYPSMLEQYLMSVRGSGVRMATVTFAQAGILGSSLSDIVDKYDPKSGSVTCDVTTDLHVIYERF